MNQSVKAPDKTGRYFQYLSKKFPGRLKRKIDEGTLNAEKTHNGYKAIKDLPNNVPLDPSYC